MKTEMTYFKSLYKIPNCRKRTNKRELVLKVSTHPHSRAFFSVLHCSNEHSLVEKTLFHFQESKVRKTALAVSKMKSHYLF